MSIELKNIDLDNISLKEQLEKVVKESKKLQHFIMNEPIENIIGEFWNVVQANLGLLSKLGINEDRVMEYYPKHLEKLKYRPKEELPKEIKKETENVKNEISGIQYLINITKDYGWNKLKDGDLVIVKRDYWIDYELRIAKEYIKKYNCVKTQDDDSFEINRNDDYIFPYTKEVVNYININCEIDWDRVPKHTPIYVRNENDYWIPELFMRVHDKKYETFNGRTWDEIKLRYDK